MKLELWNHQLEAKTDQVTISSESGSGNHPTVVDFFYQKAIFPWNGDYTSFMICWIRIRKTMNILL